MRREISQREIPTLKRMIHNKDPKAMVMLRKIEKEIKVTEIPTFYDTLMDDAIKGDYKEFAEYLIEKYYTGPTENGWKEILRDISKIEWIDLFTQHSLISSINTYGYNIVKYSSYDVLNYLVDRRQDVFTGIIPTPLEIAVYMRDDLRYEILIKHGTEQYSGRDHQKALSIAISMEEYQEYEIFIRNLICRTKSVVFPEDIKMILEQTFESGNITKERYELIEKLI